MFIYRARNNIFKKKKNPILCVHQLSTDYASSLLQITLRAKRLFAYTYRANCKVKSETCGAEIYARELWESRVYGYATSSFWRNYEVICYANTYDDDGGERDARKWLHQLFAEAKRDRYLATSDNALYNATRVAWTSLQVYTLVQIWLLRLPH